MRYARTSFRNQFKILVSGGCPWQVQSFQVAAQKLNFDLWKWVLNFCKTYTRYITAVSRDQWQVGDHITLVEFDLLDSRTEWLKILTNFLIHIPRKEKSRRRQFPNEQPLKYLSLVETIWRSLGKNTLRRGVSSVPQMGSLFDVTQSTVQTNNTVQEKPVPQNKTTKLSGQSKERITTHLQILSQRNERSSQKGL